MKFLVIFIVALSVNAALAQKGGKCISKLDLEIVFDGSNSISSRAWDLQVDFLEGIATSFYVGDDSTHVGLVQFSSEVVVEFPLGGDKAGLLAAISKLHHMRRNTDIGDGLLKGASQLKTLGRSGVKGVLMLITDGVANKGPDPVSTAADIKADGTVIYGIGVGAAATKKLKEIVSPPADLHYYVPSSFAELNKTLQELIKNTCPRVVSIHPKSGPPGTVVTITGTNFGPGDNITCAFGDRTSPGTFSPPDTITCEAPPPEDPTEPSIEPVSISEDGHHFTTEDPTESPQYTYTPKGATPPNPTSISPGEGPMEGGTDVRITGTGFVASSNSSCRFGGPHYQVKADSVQSDEMYCTSPSHASGYVSLEVSNDGKVFVEAGTYGFIFE